MLLCCFLLIFANFRPNTISVSSIVSVFDNQTQMGGVGSRHELNLIHSDNANYPRPQNGTRISQYRCVYARACMCSMFFHIISQKFIFLFIIYVTTFGTHGGTMVSRDVIMIWGKNFKCQG